MDCTGILKRAGRYCIHKFERTDREEQMHRELGYFFLEDEPWTVWPATILKPAWMGIAASHQSVIEQAKELKFEAVITMEDDLRMHSGARPHIEEALKNVPDDWEVLTFGMYTGQIFDSPGFPMWKRCKDASGGHFLVWRDTAYDRFLAYDRATHFDRQITMTMGLKQYCIYPMCISQHPGHSDNVKGHQDYDHLLKKYSYLPFDKK